jgi:hypothetical protein
MLHDGAGKGFAAAHICYQNSSFLRPYLLGYRNKILDIFRHGCIHGVIPIASKNRRASHA